MRFYYKSVRRCSTSHPFSQHYFNASRSPVIDTLPLVCQSHARSLFSRSHRSTLRSFVSSYTKAEIFSVNNVTESFPARPRSVNVPAHPIDILPMQAPLQNSGTRELLSQFNLRRRNRSTRPIKHFKLKASDPFNFADLENFGFKNIRNDRR